MNTSTIVQKLWNYCNVLRDAGPLLHSAAIRARTVVPLLREFGDPLASAPRSHPRKAEPLFRAPRRKHSYGDYVEQLTYLLFLNMADERTKAPYNQKSPVPEQYSWPSLIKKDGDELFDHYRHMLQELGNLVSSELDWGFL